MTSKSDLSVGARKLVQTCAKVKARERVLVVTDTGRSLRIGQEVYRASLDAGAEAVIMIMEPGAYPGAEVPQAVAEAMKASDVIFGMTTSSLYHTQARLAACRAGARLVAATEITEEVMVSGGIEADFEAQLPLVEELTRKMSQAHDIRLTTPGGTDLKGKTGGRSALKFTGLAHAKGDAVGVPTIEAAIAPFEGTCEGVLVVDGSGTYLGMISNPVRITVEKGRALTITGGEKAAVLTELLEKQNDPNCWNIGEIGIGLNPCCRVSGNIIEDEGKLGTCHVALGNNVTLGGANRARVHIDLVMWKPTLYLDGKVVFSAEPVGMK